MMVLSLLATRVGGLGKRAHLDAEAFHETRIAEPSDPPADTSFDALACDGLEILDFGRLETFLLGPAQDRRGKRMLAACLERSGEAQHLVRRKARGHLDAGQRWLAFGQGPGLVGDQRIDAARRSSAAALRTAPQPERAAGWRP
jgi:hypothetical protein